MSDELIAAWMAWERHPGSEWTAARKIDAIRAAGLDVISVHDRVAACRRAGMSVPDAIQSAVNAT